MESTNEESMRIGNSVAKSTLEPKVVQCASDSSETLEHGSETLEHGSETLEHGSDIIIAMQEVIKYAHILKGFVFGGYCRDYLILGQTPKDLDIFVLDCNRDILIKLIFTQFNANIVKIYNKSKYSGTFNHHRIQITLPNNDNNQVQFDVDVISAESPKHVRYNCDFTCNLLVFYNTGLKVRYIPKCLKYCSSPYIKVISDIINKQLCILDAPPKANMQSVIRILTRTNNMLNRGWIFNQLDVFIEHNDDEPCSVCQDNINGWAYILGCSHQFHTECITKWLKREEKCPNCRAAASLPTVEEIFEVCEK